MSSGKLLILSDFLSVSLFLNNCHSYVRKKVLLWLLRGKMGEMNSYEFGDGHVHTSVFKMDKHQSCTV